LSLPLRDTNRDSEAESLLQESLAIERKLLHGESKEAADALRGLGVVLWREHRYAEAEAVEREALAIRRKLYGSESKDVADAMFRLAQILESEGRVDEAENMLREAAAISRKRARKSPDLQLAQTLEALAGLLQHKGDLPAAEAAARESV